MFEIWKQLPLRNNKNSPHEIFKIISTLMFYQREMKGLNLSLPSLVYKLSCGKYIF